MSGGWNFAEIWERIADKFPDAQAQVQGDRRFTWTEFDRRADGFFCEVRVDEELGQVRVTRIVNAVAAGRIINPKTARSQVLGGVVMGIGMALQEETFADTRMSRWMNHNLAEYHVPAHADVERLQLENDAAKDLLAQVLAEINDITAAAGA